VSTTPTTTTPNLRNIPISSSSVSPLLDYHTQYSSSNSRQQRTIPSNRWDFPPPPHCGSSTNDRRTTRLYLEMEPKEDNNNNNDRSTNTNNELVTTKTTTTTTATNANNDDDDDDDGRSDLVTAFLASFPELSFWNVANDNNKENQLRNGDLIRSLLRRSANLSLQDYNWRSDYFKKSEADRRVEESMARMMGEDAAYVRPMDAADDKIGPLGRAERKLVQWLSLVIEEEGRRAQLIASSEGDLIRPIDLQPSGEGGPLSALEYTAVSFLDTIRNSEEERAKTLTLRPKDLEEEKRGPLGEAELKAVQTIERIRESELLRQEQSRARGGEVVRPIDVPGPLGELERWYVELFSAELTRARDAVRNDGAFRRPKEMGVRGPMGDTEQKASDALKVIKDEEMERLRSIQKVLMENRPMERDRESTLGLIEAVIVGIYKGPQLLFRVIDRVSELMQSSPLQDQDNVGNSLSSLSSTNLDGKNPDDDDDDDDDDDNRD